MIMITKTPSGGLLLTTTTAELLIDAPAISSALPVIIASLTDNARAIGSARQDGYEAGLIVGYANGERETRQQYLREAAEIADNLKLLRVNATLAA